MRSNRANTIIVTLTLLALAGFVGFGLPSAVAGVSGHTGTFFAGNAEGSSASGFFHATALMFVAYTGYGRIATLGEEVHDPRRGIPRAIIVTLASTAVIYALVAFVAMASAGAGGLAKATKQAAAPLEVIAHGRRSRRRVVDRCGRRHGDARCAPESPPGAVQGRPGHGATGRHVTAARRIQGCRRAVGAGDGRPQRQPE